MHARILSSIKTHSFQDTSVSSAPLVIFRTPICCLRTLIRFIKFPNSEVVSTLGEVSITTSFRACTINYFDHYFPRTGVHSYVCTMVMIVLISGDCYSMHSMVSWGACIRSSDHLRGQGADIRGLHLSGEILLFCIHAHISGARSICTYIFSTQTPFPWKNKHPVNQQSPNMSKHEGNSASSL